MSYVFILTQTIYKYWEEYEREENGNVSITAVYTGCKEANDAAREWIEYCFSDGDNEKIEMDQDENGCETWTCRLDEDDRSHVLMSVVKMALLGEPEDSAVAGKKEEEGGNNNNKEHIGQANRTTELQEPPTKRVCRV